MDDEHPSPLTLGALLTLRYLMPLLQQQVKDTTLKGSFGVTRKEPDISPTPEQLVQVPARPPPPPPRSSAVAIYCGPEG